MNLKLLCYVLLSLLISNFQVINVITKLYNINCKISTWSIISLTQINNLNKNYAKVKVLVTNNTLGVFAVWYYVLNYTCIKSVFQTLNKKQNKVVFMLKLYAKICIAS